MSWRKEEERRAEGMFAQARDAGLDVEALGEQMAEEKKALVAKYKSTGVPKPPTPSFTGTQLA